MPKLLQPQPYNPANLARALELLHAHGQLTQHETPAQAMADPIAHAVLRLQAWCLWHGIERIDPATATHGHRLPGRVTGPGPRRLLGATLARKRRARLAVFSAHDGKALAAGPDADDGHE